jgi:uncharacterized Tic20 family protein
MSEESNGVEPSEQAPAPGPNDTELERQTRQWAMFIHFSVLASWIVPLAGIIVPILLWQIKKDELPGIVPHAHVVMNWLVTSFVYGLICFLLTIIVIGIFGFIALAIVTLVFSILGGIKANEGELWEYPGTFIKVFKE